MKARHLFVGGPSGGGKTTLARQLHASHDAGPSVWVDYEGAGDLPGVTVRSLADMVRMVRGLDSSSQIRHLTLNLRCADGTAGVEAARRFAESVGDRFGGQYRTQILVDECQNVMPDDETASDRSNNPLTWLFHEGRDVPARVVAITQDPVEVYYPPIKNMEYFVWVGEIKTWHVGFLRYWGFDDLDLPNENHRYAVVKPSKTPEIVETGETDPSYG